MSTDCTAGWLYSGLSHVYLSVCLSVCQPPFLPPPSRDMINIVIGPDTDDELEAGGGKDLGYNYVDFVGNLGLVSWTERRRDRVQGEAKLSLRNQSVECVRRVSSQRLLRGDWSWKLESSTAAERRKKLCAVNKKQLQLLREWSLTTFQSLKSNSVIHDFHQAKLKGSNQILHKKYKYL